MDCLVRAARGCHLRKQMWSGLVHQRLVLIYGFLGGAFGSGVIKDNVVIYLYSLGLI